MFNVQLREGEFMTVGENVRIYCTKASSRGSVTLGIDAPKEVQILRTKHIEENLKILAEAGDTQAQASLQKLDEARQARAAKRQARESRTAKRATVAS